MAARWAAMRPLRVLAAAGRRGAPRPAPAPRAAAGLAAGACAGLAAGALAWARPGAEAEERPAYEPPARFGRKFASLGAAMPGDEAGMLAWAVKNLEVDKVKQVLDKWPHGATLLDTEDNTLFHLAASQPSRSSAQPAAAEEVMKLLLCNGWGVVDLKNKKGERAELVAARLDPQGTMMELLKSRSHDFQEKLRPEQPIALIGDESPCPWKWEYALQDEQRRSYAGVLKAAFPPEQCAKWTKAHLEEGIWFQPEGVPRRTSWYVSEDCLDCPYRYSGLEYPASAFPPFMQEIRAEVCKLCGIPPEQYPNSCNVNVYEDQKHEVGWHSDDEVLFQGLSGDTRIISFSLGVPRDFCWRLQGTTGIVGSVPLGDGDIMTMEGLFQKHYKHSVPPAAERCGSRINMTFRWIVVKAHAADAGTKGVN